MAGDQQQRILLLGANGQVGHELQRALAANGTVIAFSRAEADLRYPDALRALVRGHQPQVIVNAAAYTAVDRAESEPEVAQFVNGVAPGVLAEEAESLRAILIHYSTDYVFDGRKSSAYTELDPTNPLSVYGKTKLFGERAVAATNRHLVLRTSWVVGAHGANFLKTILRLAEERESLRVVADQFGAPTSAALIADSTRHVLSALVSAPENDPRWGLYHLTAGGETSWYSYARYVIERARQLGRPLKATPESIAPIASVDYPTAAMRPANSRLSSKKFESTFGLTLPEWRQGVDDVLTEISAGRA